MNIRLTTSTTKYLQELVAAKLQEAYDELETEDFNAAYSAATDLKMEVSHYDDFDERIKEAKLEAEGDSMFEMLRDMDSDSDN